MKKAPFWGAFYLSIPLSRRFSILFKRSNSPSGAFSLTLLTKSLKRLLKACKPSVCSFKNSLVLLYIDLISLFKSVICVFNLSFFQFFFFSILLSFYFARPLFHVILCFLEPNRFLSNVHSLF